MGQTSNDRIKHIAEYALLYGKRNAASHFNISKKTVTNYIAEANRLNLLDYARPNPQNTTLLNTEDTIVYEYQYDENSDTVNLNGKISSKITDRIKILDDFLTQCNVDTEIYEVDRYLLNAWDVTMKIDNTHGETYTNYQIKVWLKKKTIVFDHEMFTKELIEDVRQYSKPFEILKPTNSEIMFEFPIVDPHWGKLGWGVETGGGNYDFKIATQRFNDSFDHHLSTVLRLCTPEQIVFFLSGDIFNSDVDYPHPMTTRKTPQENDYRWQKAFRTVRTVIGAKIEQAAQIAPVKVIPIQGNHDFQKMFYLTEAFAAKYYNNPNITIDDSPRTRKYHVWGDVLLGFAHGNRKDEGEKRLSYLMQQEQRENWGKTKFAEWHLGDIHHNKQISFISTEDNQGMVMRYLWSFKELDGWESQKGYLSEKGSSSFLWDKKKGLIHQIHHGI